MGLFDFVKDVGRQIFDTDAEAADNIKQHLEIKTSGLSNLTVEFDDGVATICGDCKNQAVRDQAILIAGNIKGVEKIVADDLKGWGRYVRFALLPGGPMMFFDEIELMEGAHTRKDARHLNNPAGTL